MTLNFQVNNTCGTATTNPDFILNNGMALNFTQEKSCAGRSKCGKPCHYSKNLKLLKKYRKNGRVYKVYCKECDETFDVDTRERCIK